MQIAVNEIGQIIEATEIRTGEERREKEYYCQESNYFTKCDPHS